MECPQNVIFAVLKFSCMRMSRNMFHTYVMYVSRKTPNTKMDKRKKRWNYHFRGNVYSFGPTSYMYQYQMKEYLCDYWGDGKRIPDGTQFWEA